MVDLKKIFDSFEQEASRVARDLDLEGAAKGARQSVDNLRERLKTDPKARTIAAGAGGLLLLSLLGSRGGRNMVGGVAKTGAVAAIGALAYKAWAARQGKPADGTDLVDAARAAGFPVDAQSDPDFALAVLRAMLASAYADGMIDAYEQRTIDAAMDKADLSPQVRAMLTNELPEDETLRLIASAAKTPHHAAELYAAAVVAAGDSNDRETAFLSKLADKLGLAGDDAEALRKAAAS